MIKPRTLAGIVSLLAPLAALAQTDSTYVAAAKDNAIRFYTKTIGVQSRLFEGSEYKDYIAQRDEYPFMHDDVVNGNIKYHGEVYKDIPLYYDLEKDQIITSYPHGNKVQLLREKVEYFEIDGHKFVPLFNTKIPDGFYDLQYDGKMKFYVHKRKESVLKVNSNGSDPHRVFEQRVKYFILKNGIFFSVKSKKSVLALLKDKKRNLKKALRAENIRFKPERERAIAFLLRNYEQTQ